MNRKEESSDDELPVVSLNSSIKKQQRKSPFKIASASVIAARRKREAELEEIASKILEGGTRSFNDSQFSLDLMTIDRKYTTEELYNMLFNEVCIDENIEVLSENPGINAKNIDFANLNFSVQNAEFLKKTFKLLHNCEKDSVLEDCLNNFVNDIYSLLNKTTGPVDLELINVFIIFFSILMLDKRLRYVITDTNKAEVLDLCLQKIPIEFQTSELVSSISQRLLKMFSHFHDRLYVAQCFQTFDCYAHEYKKHSMLLGNRICIEILHHTLFGILHIEYNEEIFQNISFCNLKKLILKIDKNTFSLYEHYVIINILYILRNGIISRTISKKSMSMELDAQNWFLTNFNRQAFASRDIDVHKVKSLLSQATLLWD